MQLGDVNFCAWIKEMRNGNKYLSTYYVPDTIHGATHFMYISLLNCQNNPVKL